MTLLRRKVPIMADSSASFPTAPAAITSVALTSRWGSPATKQHGCSHEIVIPVKRHSSQDQSPGNLFVLHAIYVLVKQREMNVIPNQSEPPALSVDSDAALCERARQGSEQAYAAIMRRHNGRLFRIARSILKDDAEAEDAVQDTYVRAFLNMEQLRDPANLSGWLLRITTNEALGRLRRQRPTVAFDEIADQEALDGGLSAADVGPMRCEDPEASAARHEVQRVLEDAVDGLPTYFRMIFVACAVEQMSITEAAACFGLPANTVKTRLHRARRLLRKSLGAEFAAALPTAFPFAGRRCDRIAARVLARLVATRPAVD